MEVLESKVKWLTHAASWLTAARSDIKRYSPSTYKSKWEFRSIRPELKSNVDHRFFPTDNTS